jgi:succinate dehydrogenase/fumarate reductase cytochrome b subunit
MAQSPIVVLIVIAALGLIVYNLGAGLYYMLTDKGETKRTVNALTRRVALSVGLILLIILGIATGVITPHDVGR